MKRVLSISLGSSLRDHGVTLELLGQELEITRRGTDGDFTKALALYREFDGKVAALGVGGSEFELHLGPRRYPLRDGQRIRRDVHQSKIGDGNGVKRLLEYNAVSALRASGEDLAGRTALITSAIDRYWLAEALQQAGCRLLVGDLLFYLGLPLPLRSLATIERLAAVLLPLFGQLPSHWFYPTGERQERPPSTRFSGLFRDADIIAGDWLQIKQYLPRDLQGRIVVTNTTTESDLQMLRERGLYKLVTTTPRLAGRSFGTNVMEALLLALLDKPQSEVVEADFKALIKRIPIRPEVITVNGSIP